MNYCETKMHLIIRPSSLIRSLYSVALQMFIVGGELATVPNTKPGFIPTTYAIFVRFLIMPALSLAFVWVTAGRGWYSDDKLVW